MSTSPIPGESVLLLIDHQPLPYLHSHAATAVAANAIALAEAARAHDVPTVLTTVVEEHNGALLQPLQDAFASQRPIQRHLISPWDDHRVQDAIAATGRTQLVLAGLHTEDAVTMSALRATTEGLAVYVVTDACGGVMAETHELAVERMARAGVTPVTWAAIGRTWAHRPLAAARM
ncbi:isochorismatase family protein [Streptomyces sp. Y7]|uniref:isochorismatase family protein n=1 Tax=Streptomyces sp. Y7 TaxID=3342392 RepID=UPI003721FB77